MSSNEEIDNALPDAERDQLKSYFDRRNEIYRDLYNLTRAEAHSELQVRINVPRGINVVLHPIKRVRTQYLIERHQAAIEIINRIRPIAHLALQDEISIDYYEIFRDLAGWVYIEPLTLQTD